MQWCNWCKKYVKFNDGITRVYDNEYKFFCCEICRKHYEKQYDIEPVFSKLGFKHIGSIIFDSDILIRR